MATFKGRGIVDTIRILIWDSSNSEPNYSYSSEQLNTPIGPNLILNAIRNVDGITSVTVVYGNCFIIRWSGVAGQWFMRVLYEIYQVRHTEKRKSLK